MITDEQIDELIEYLGETVDSLESGLSTDPETRQIIRTWIEKYEHEICGGF